MESENHSTVTAVRHVDDFDAYFARAAKDASFHPFQPVFHDDEDPEKVEGSTRPFLSVTRFARDGGLSPRRSASCKYPSRKRSVSPRQGGSPSRTPATPASGKNSESGLCAPILGVWNRSSSAPQSRSSSWKRLKRPPSFRDLATNSGAHQHGDQHSQGGLGCGNSPKSGTGNLEEMIIDKLQQLKLLKEADCCVVRGFNTSPKGDIIEKFDMYKRISTPSVRSICAGEIHGKDDVAKRGADVAHAGVSEIANGEASLVRNATSDVCKVAVLGQSHVGKTALIQQFMTSHYMAAVCTSFDDEADKTVCVVLNGEETMINFVDAGTPTKQEYVGRKDVDAYVLVYSITAPSSFRYVCEVLCNIRCEEDAAAAAAAATGNRGHPVVILVANKSDLVRTKHVSEAEAKYVCSCLDCKYVEVSASLNHRIDDLLVGIVRQIKRNRNRTHQRTHDRTAATKADENRRCIKGAKELLKELFIGDFCLPPSSNCDNLFDL